MNKSKLSLTLKQKVKNFFNDEAQIAHYTSEVTNGVTSAENYLLNCIPKSKSVILDFGCGCGRVSIQLARKNHSIYALDISDKLIKIAKSNLEELNLPIQYLHYEDDNLPYSNNFFDFVVAFKVFSYIPTAEKRKVFLNEINRVLKPGGMLLLTQNIVPDEFFDDYKDEFYEYFEEKFGMLEPGDTFPMGVGFVHWFRSNELFSEIKQTNLKIDLFENDENYEGNGLMQLIKLKK